MFKNEEYSSSLNIYLQKIYKNLINSQVLYPYFDL